MNSIVIDLHNIDWMILPTSTRKREVIMCLLESKNFSIFPSTRGGSFSQQYPILMHRSDGGDRWEVIGYKMEIAPPCYKKNITIFTADFFIYFLTGVRLDKEE